MFPDLSLVQDCAIAVEESLHLRASKGGLKAPPLSQYLPTLPS